MAVSGCGTLRTGDSVNRPYLLAFYVHAGYMCGMKFLLPALVLFFGTPVFAEPAIDQLAEGELPSLLAMYKDLHAHPELSTREEQTSALVAKELRAAGCEVTDHF